MMTAIIIGAILVCAFIAGVTAWLFCRADDEKIEEARQVPFLEDDD